MAQFSIILPTYNRAQKLEQTVNSVFAQKFGSWELIVVDDGSTDNTYEMIRPFLWDDRIKYVRQSNQGVSAARNTGAKRARGDFLLFLDSDDEVKPDWLLDFHNLAKGNENVGYMSCGWILNGSQHKPSVVPEISSSKYASVAGRFAIQREVFDAIGGYDENLRQSESWEMTARALEWCATNGLSVVYTDSCNFIYHHEKTAEQTIQRDRDRAYATRYLYKKYYTQGVLHFRKKDLLVSAAVNFTRSGDIAQARECFWSALKEDPCFRNMLRVLIFEIPILRRKKWVRSK